MLQYVALGHKECSVVGRLLTNSVKQAKIVLTMDIETIEHNIHSTTLYSC